MKPQLIAITVLLAVVIFYSLWSRLRTNETVNDADTQPALPLREKRNDKLILVKNVSHSDVQNVLKGLCKLYNENNLQVKPRLVKLDEREFAITFPYDVDFEIYSYFINYLYYPMELNWKPDIKAWATTGSSDPWIPEKAANKQVMFFIPADDNEHDNVYLTTADDIGYKLGFAVGEQKQLLKVPGMSFVQQPVEFSAFTGKEYEDFR